MPTIAYIPEKYEEGFKKMASMETSAFDNLVSALSSISLFPSIKSLIGEIAKVKNLNTNDLAEIFVSAGSLCPLVEKISIEEIVNDISSVVKSKNLVPETSIDNLKKVLGFLLSNDKLYYAAKTYSLLTEYGNIFLSARIVTDVRPVFGYDVNETPKGALIIHNLHLHYQADEESDHKDIYLALDAADIKSLKEALERAENKEKNLKLLLKGVSLQLLNE